MIAITVGCPWNSADRLWKNTEWTGNQRKNWDNPDHSTAQIDSDS